MQHSLIKTLDLNHYVNPSTREGFLESLHTVLSDTGFFFLKNHGISENVFENCLRASRSFFNLSIEKKSQYEFPDLDRQCGYTPLGLEKGEYARIPDLKEFFQIGDMYANPDIVEVPDFIDNAQKLFNAFRRTFQVVLRAIAESLKLPADYFKGKEGNSIMRSIFYPANANPPMDDEAVEDEGETPGGNALGMCASRHTDIDMVTLLFARSTGLQLKYDGHYIPVIIPSVDSIIVNAGDMLEHLTGGKYVSGLHRVVCEPNIARYSIPFFGHIRPEASIIPIFADADTAKYPYQTAGEYLNVRLEQIGLRKETVA